MTDDYALKTMQPGEQKIFQIKRHPIGIFQIYGVVLILILAAAVLMATVTPALFGDGNTAAGLAAGGILLAIISALGLAVAFIANIIYWGNSWILTSDSITQVAQTGLFHKQSSQLSLNNLEDVTVEQNGIFTHIFNYGTIKAETAGERSKFMFTYCPNPNFYAQRVLQAREAFEQGGKYEAPHYQEGQVVSGSSQFTGNTAPTYDPNEPK